MLYRYLLLLLFACASLAADVMPPLRLADVHTQMNRIFRIHPSQNAMKAHIMQLALANYINEFDPNHIYLTQADVTPYLGLPEKAQEKLVLDYYKEDYSIFERLNGTIQRSIEKMREYRQGMNLTEEQANALSEKELAPLPPNALLEISTFSKTEVEQQERAKVYIAKSIVDERNHMKALGMPATFSDAQKAVEYRLAEVEDDYLYRNSKQEHLPAEERQAFFAFHILQSLALSLDVHTQFLNPHQAQALSLQLSKGYVGVGINVDEEGASFVVAGIAKGSSAEKNGQISVGDTIISIDGHNVEGMRAVDMLLLLHGKEGTSAEIILQNRTKGVYTVTLERAPLVVEENRVDSSFEKVPGGILAILKLHGFYEGKWPISSAEDIRNALDELKQNGQIKGVLLDMRDNHGGLLPQAVEVAGLFMRSGVVAAIKDNYSRLHFLRHTNPRLFYDGPLVILTSKETASAAEIVAGCLQDYGVAIIVGDTQTYGKGSLQLQSQHEPISSTVTIGRYYTVSGRSPQVQGVKADIVVPGRLAQASVGEAVSSEALKPDSIPPSYKDPLLDIPRYQRTWFQRYYLPFLQQKTDKYTKYLPELIRLHNERMAKNPTYENLLHGNFVIESGEPPKKVILSQAEANKMVSEMQLKEAISITKDLISESAS